MTNEQTPKKKQFVEGFLKLCDDTGYTIVCTGDCIEKYTAWPNDLGNWHCEKHLREQLAKEFPVYRRFTAGVPFDTVLGRFVILRVWPHPNAKPGAMLTQVGAADAYAPMCEATWMGDCYAPLYLENQLPCSDKTAKLMFPDGSVKGMP